MKKLTKIERHTAYIIMLHEYKHNRFFYEKYSLLRIGVCKIFKYVFGIDLDEDLRFSNMKSLLPELWSKRNRWANEDSPYLWDAPTERIAALQQCIEETY